MRNVITFTVLILLFSLFSGAAFAGKFDYECGDFKKQKQLYGLCSAYQNALAHEDVDAMADIERNWDKRVGEQGLPELPNRVDGNRGCPCWTEEQMRVAVCTLEMNTAPTATFIEWFGSRIAFNTNEVFFQAGVAVDDFDSTECIHQNAMALPSLYEKFRTTPEQDGVCRAAVSLMIDGGLSDLCN